MPDIGDFKDVEIIEVLVAVGDEVKAEQSLITLESDKASMDIPAPENGVIDKLKDYRGTIATIKTAHQAAADDPG